MLGGALPSGLDTENLSVRHCVACEARMVPDGSGAPPLLSLVTELVLVEGPAMVKETKSRRSWQMLSPHGQMVAVQAPGLVLALSK